MLSGQGNYGGDISSEPPSSSTTIPEASSCAGTSVSMSDPDALAVKR
jgi:hypothetical protein